MAETTIREIVGVFHDAAALRKAADELMTSGFDRSELSLLGSRKAVEEKLGSASQSTTDLEDNPRVPMQAYVGTDSLNEAKSAIVGVPAFVGAFAAAGASIAHGADMTAIVIWVIVGIVFGLVVGAISMKMLTGKASNYLQDQVKRGGILLWVRTTTADKEAKASEIMKRNNAKDVHVHDRPVVEEWAYVYGYLDRLAGDRPPAS